MPIMLKLAASIITFLFLIPYTASLYNGLSRLFDMAFPGSDYAVFVIIMAVLTGVYVIAGGYMAAALNDFIQGIIMLGGMVAGGCYFLGGFGRLYDVNVAEEGFDAVIPRMLSTLPVIIIGVVVVLVLSASMSTLSSLVLTSASTITLDFIEPIRKKPMNEKQKMGTIRLFIVVFIAISALIAIRQAKDKSIFIAQMMGVSWGALAGAFLAPFLYGLYSKKITRAAVAVSFAFGVLLETVQLFISLGVFSAADSPVLSLIFRNSIFSGSFAMLGGLILVPIVSRLTQKSLPEGVEEKFSCYHENRTVEITDNLGE